MSQPCLDFGVFFTTLTSLLLLFSSSVQPQPCVDYGVMSVLKETIVNSNSLGWFDFDCCNWSRVSCVSDRVSAIQIGNQNLRGLLPSDLSNLTSLTIFEVQNNALTGPFPNLPATLQRILAHNNYFTSFPIDFFVDKSDLTEIDIDENPFSAWRIPESILDATSLVEFSANEANITGGVPAIFGGNSFPSLTSLHLSMNNLEGQIPNSFVGSGIQSLWLSGQQGTLKLNGSISLLQNMTSLAEIWLHGNQFSGRLPDFSNFKGLQNLSLRDNQLTGIVPSSLVQLKTLVIVNLTNNLLQGPTPKFDSTVQLDMRSGSNRFCLETPGQPCDGRVNALLLVAQAVGYPTAFAESWQHNDPCQGWLGITCDDAMTKILIINFNGKNLSGTISPSFALLTSLKSLFLANNSLTGTIPFELTTMPNLVELDVSNNDLYGKVPSFSKNVVVLTDGNRDIGKDRSSVRSSSTGEGEISKTGLIIGSVVGSIVGLLLVWSLVFFLFRQRQNRRGRLQASNAVVIHPRVARGGSVFNTHSSLESGPSNIHVGEDRNMVNSIRVLRNVTNNFSDENILGRGGFGSVYKGELNDGTLIAVKRMESGGMSEKGLSEFTAEITVLTTVRHRNLVGLLGYCLDGHERLLVYEYMPLGPLSRHLFKWREEGLEPLEWSRRVSIALDVARGVEYLHSLAHRSFIHRDLKPSNILLGEDMHAKVADFGLVRLAPVGTSSVATRLAGTFGYLAPEYAVTGRVTTKIDVYSFGVILMELITGRKALDESRPEDSVHLVLWFERMLGSDQGIVDETIATNDEALSSIGKVTELACHCCEREPSRRPDMGHVVRVLSSLVDQWEPEKPNPDQVSGTGFKVCLNKMVKRWQAGEKCAHLDESSSLAFLLTGDRNAMGSSSTRSSGFEDSLNSTDGQ